MRTPLLCLTALVIGSLLVIPTVASAQSDYKTNVSQSGTSILIAESQGPTPPQTLQGYWETTSPADISINYNSTMDRGRFKFYAYGEGYGFINVGGDATWGDFVFECDDGREDIDVIANHRIKGRVTVYDWGPWGYVSGFQLGFGLIHGSHWHWAASGDPNWLSLGVFAGLPGGHSEVDQWNGLVFTIDDVFAIPLGTVATGVPQSVSLGKANNVGMTGNIYASVRPYFGGVVADFGGEDGGISFATDGPAFDLPEGCTCNSAEANIVDNVWQGVEVAPATVTISGTVTSDCDGPLADVTVMVFDGNGVFVCTETTCAVTCGQGEYSISGIPASTSGGTVELIPPVGYTAPDPISIPLDADQTDVNAELTCVYTSVSGTVESECGGPLSGVTVTLTPQGGAPLSTTTLADGSFSFGDLRASNVVAELAVDPPAGYDPFPAEPGTEESLIDITSDQTDIAIALVCQVGSVEGTVSADCPALDTPLEGVQIDAYEAVSGAHAGTALSDPNGDYSIDGLLVPVGNYTITVVPPAGYEVASNNVVVTVAAGEAAAADFPLTCLPVNITGNVSAQDASGQPCPGGLLGVTVDLDHPNGEMFTTSTDANGDYTFTDVLQSADDAVVAIVVPLGYAADNPATGQVLVDPNQDQAVDFTLICQDPTGEARSMGYWKHQANVYLKNKGNAHETQADMQTNYPSQIFNHFHENDLNAIEVEGVTYMDNGVGRMPLDLTTIHATLSVKGNAGMEAKTKQQYLAFLLNIASGKLLTSSIVSNDGATASQTLQHVAALINDGDSSNDELAKDICDTINNAQLVAAGVIDLSYGDIAYSPGRGETPLVENELSLGQNYPNPFNPTTNILFVVDQTQFVELAIYNAAGRLVRTLVSGQMAPGTYVEEWDARDSSGREVSTGIYFYRLKTAQATLTRKMVFLK